MSNKEELEESRVPSMLEEAWQLIASVGKKDGGWLSQSDEWREEAIRWRDAFHALLEKRKKPWRISVTDLRSAQDGSREGSFAKARLFYYLEGEECPHCGRKKHLYDEVVYTRHEEDDGYFYLRCGSCDHPSIMGGSETLTMEIYCLNYR